MAEGNLYKVKFRIVITTVSSRLMSREKSFSNSFVYHGNKSCTC